MSSGRHRGRDDDGDGDHHDSDRGDRDSNDRDRGDRGGNSGRRGDSHGDHDGRDVQQVATHLSSFGISSGTCETFLTTFAVFPMHETTRLSSALPLRYHHHIQLHHVICLKTHTQRAILLLVGQLLVVLEGQLPVVLEVPSVLVGEAAVASGEEEVALRIVLASSLVGTR